MTYIVCIDLPLTDVQVDSQAKRYGFGVAFVAVGGLSFQDERCGEVYETDTIEGVRTQASSKLED